MPKLITVSENLLREILPDVKNTPYPNIPKFPKSPQSPLLFICQHKNHSFIKIKLYEGGAVSSVEKIQA